MTVKEYQDKLTELLSNIESENSESSKINGLMLSDDSKVGVSVININGSPTIVFSDLDDNGYPTNILYGLLVKDLQSAKRLQVWTTNVVTRLSQSLLSDSEADSLIFGKL